MPKFVAIPRQLRHSGRGCAFPRSDSGGRNWGDTSSSYFAHLAPSSAKSYANVFPQKPAAIGVRVPRQPAVDVPSDPSFLAKPIKFITNKI